MNETLDVSQINVSEPKVGHEGIRNVALTYGADKKPLLFRSSALLSFGINTWPGPPPAHSVTLSFYGKEDVTQDAFYGVLHVMDQWLLHTAKANLWAWLKCKALSDDSLRAQHFATLRGLAVKFKLKLKPTARDAFTTLFFNKNQQLLPTTAAITSHFTKGSLACVLVECTGVWISKEGRFGFTWKLHQIMIDPKEEQEQEQEQEEQEEQAEQGSQCMIEDDD